MAGVAAGGAVPLSSGSVAAPDPFVAVTARAFYLPAGATQRSLAWLLPVAANGAVAHASARLQIWTPAAATAVELNADVRMALLREWLGMC